MYSIQLIERIDCQDKSVLQISEECPPPGWVSVFQKAKSELKLISQILSQLGPYFPLNKNIFRAFDLTPLQDVKIVILGQDPYHSTENGYPQANGLSFSTNRGCTIQPSLLNIYQELAREYPQNEPGHKQFIPPNHGDLSKWAEQGVLMLNICLTVKPHEAGSHMDKKKENGSFWNGFIMRILEAINEANPDCIFMLWGSPAIKFSHTRLGQRSIKLYATYPSPFSCNKASNDAPAFMGCDHFKLANEYLIKQGKEPIDWTLD